jgi:hypothetical protein
VYVPSSSVVNEATLQPSMIAWCRLRVQKNDASSRFCTMTRMSGAASQAKPCRLRVREVPQPSLLVGLGKAAPVLFDERHLGGAPYELQRLTLSTDVEGRAQDVVTLHQQGERPLQDRPVQPRVHQVGLDVVVHLRAGLVDAVKAMPACMRLNG